LNIVLPVAVGPRKQIQSGFWEGQTNSRTETNIAGSASVT